VSASFAPGAGNPSMPSRLRPFGLALAIMLAFTASTGPSLRHPSIQPAVADTDTVATDTNTVIFDEGEILHTPPQTGHPPNVYTTFTNNLAACPAGVTRVAR